MNSVMKAKLQKIMKDRQQDNSGNNLKSLLKKGAEKEKAIDKENHGNHHDINSEELHEAQLFFNNPVSSLKQNKMQEEGNEEQPKIKGILKQDKMAAEESDKKSKTVSFYEQGRPIYLMPVERKWNDKIENEKKGKFDPQEQRALCDAVGQFLATNEIMFEEFKKMISDGSNSVFKKQKFFKLLSNVLPNRSPVSCYKFIMREYNQMNHRGPWTPQEVDQLLALVDKYGRKWKMIGKELNRTSDNVYDKYRSLGEESFEERVKRTWRLNEIVTLLSEIQNQSKTQFLDRKVKEVLAKEEEHNAQELKDLENHKYNTKYFVFHNIEVLRPYIDGKNMKSINIEKISWKKIQKNIPTKTTFDCRNKFVQILQVSFSKNSYQLDDVLVEFLERQNARQESNINWKKWSCKEFTPEEARNRLMILKKLIEGRSTKEFSAIVQGIRAKVEKKRGQMQKN